MSDIVKKANKIFSPNRMESVWKFDTKRYAEFGGLSVNLKIFLQNRAKNMSLEASAWATPSGKAASAAGFKNVAVTESIENGKSLVQASFTK